MPEMLIIGGGFSGLCMAIQLKRQLGLQDFLLFERNSKVGGVYVACDVPTALYSFSFGQRYWKDLYTDGATIQDYLQSMAYRYQILHSNTMLLSEIVAATWNENSKCWTVKVMDKSEESLGRITEYTCKILISAVGNMSVPNKLPGEDIFRGTMVHSGAYDHSVDVKAPNSGSAYNSEVFMIRCQVNMVLKRLITPVLIDEDVDSVVIKPEKEANWTSWLRKEMSDTVLGHCTQGRYTDKESSYTTIYPRSHMHHWWQTYMTPSTDSFTIQAI